MATIIELIATKMSAIVSNIRLKMKVLKAHHLPRRYY